MDGNYLWKLIITGITVLCCFAFLESKKFIKLPTDSGTSNCALLHPGCGCVVSNSPSIESFCQEIFLKEVYTSFCMAAVQCAYLCHQRKDCISFNYIIPSQSCQLFDFYPFAFYDNPQCQHFEVPKSFDVSLPQGNRNLALRKRSLMSSTFNNSQVGYGSWLAFDGNLGTNVEANQCAYSKLNRPKWLAVDLELMVEVATVKVLTGNDSTGATRLYSLKAHVFNSSSLANIPSTNHLKLCGECTGRPGQMSSINCSLATPAARFVLIYQWSYNNLAICEMEVYARKG